MRVQHRLTTSSGNREKGWWSGEMLIFHFLLKVIWGNGSFCVGEYVMQEQSKNIPSCFHSNSLASISLNVLIQSFNPLCGLCPVCRGIKWCLWSVFTGVCACRLLLSTSGSGNGLEKGDDGLILTHTDKETAITICKLLSPLHSVSPLADPKTSEDGPWEH